MFQYQVIIPIFDFSIQGDCSLNIHDENSDYSYSLCISSISNHDATSLPCIERYLSDTQENIFYENDLGYADYYIALHITYNDQRTDLNNNVNPIDTIYITDSIIKSLYIFDEGGFKTKNQYVFRLVENTIIDQLPYIKISSLLYPSFISSPLAKGLCIHRTDDNDKLESVYKYLLNLQGQQTKISRLVSLALNNLYYSLCCHDWRCSYLQLMIIYDSLFKEPEKNSHDAIKRIKKFLGNNRTEIKLLNKEFGGDGLSFYRIRNCIAHGDPELSIQDIYDKYQKLFGYTCKIIVDYITKFIPTVTNDYFEDLDRYIDNKTGEES